MRGKPLLPVLLALAFSAGSACMASALDFGDLWRAEMPGRVRSSPTLWSNGAERGVLVTSEGGMVRLYSPDGTVRWSYETKGDAYNCTAAVADTDLDGNPETVVGSVAGRVTCLDSEGKPRWQRRLRGRFDWCSPVISDLDGDAKLEVALGDSEGYVTVLDHAGKMLWRFECAGPIGTPLAAGDINGDGRAELLVPCGDGTIYTLGTQGRCLWLYREKNADLYCAPTVADLDGDGSLEVLLGYGTGKLVCFDGATGRVRWTTDTGSGIDSAVSVADLDGDGKLEILVGHHEDGLVCLSSEGKVLWRVERELGRSGFAGVISAAAVGDLDGDGAPDILFGYRHGPLVALDRGGKMISETPVGEGMNSTPLVADLNGDGRLEVAVTSVGQVICLSTAGAGPVQWGSFRNGARLAGAAASVSGPIPMVRPEAPGEKAGGPTLAFKGLDADQSLLVVGPVRQSGILCAEVRRPDGVTYSKAQIVQAGQSMDVRFEPCAAGEYTARASLQTAGRYLVTEMKQDLPVFSEHLRLARQACSRVGEILSGFDLSPGGAGAGLLARQALVAGMATSIDEVAALGDAERVRKLGAQAQAIVAKANHMERTAEILGRRSDDCPVLLWRANPWKPFDEMALPDGDPQPTANLGLLYQDERRPVALDILNVSERTLGVRVVPQDITRGEDRLPWQDNLELLILRPVGSRKGTEVWDPLPRLGPERVVELPPMEARQLWVIVNTAGLKPGRYVSVIRLATTEQWHRERQIRLEFEVMPLSLKAARQLRFCNWAYFYNPGNYLSHCQKEAVADLVKHGTNVFVLTGDALPRATFDAEGGLVAPIDWTEHDRVVGMLQSHGMLLYCGYQSGVRGPLQPHTVAWDRAHDTLVRELVRHLAGMGIGYDDFALYPVDEPGLTKDNAGEYIRMAKAGKRADPRVQVYTDPVAGMDIAQLEEAAPYTDIWCPGVGSAQSRPEEVKLMLRTGAVWSYACGDHAKTQSPTLYYRVPSWYAFRDGLRGVGFWTYCTTSYNPWLGDEEGEGEYVLVYPGAEPISSRRWEAAAAGLQDYAALDLLRQAIEKAKGRADPALVSGARSALDQMVTKVCSSGEAAEDDDGRSMDAARADLARWTLRLREAAQ